MNQIKKYFGYKLSLLLLAVSLLIFFIVDGIYKIEVRGGYGSFRLGIIVKGLFELFFFLYAIILLNKQKLHLLFSIFIFALFFLTGQYLIYQEMTDLHFGDNLNRFFKYILIILLYIAASDVLDSDKYPEKLLKLYKSIIWINGFVIIIALLLSIKVFRTYAGPWRFGYNGLIYAQNDSSYFFIFALTTFYYRRFYLFIKEWIFWLILITSILVATKAVFLFILLLILFHLTQRVSIKKILIVGLSLAVAGYLIFSSIINKILLNAWGVFQYNYHKGGLLFALLSGRNTFLQAKFIPLVTQIWTLPNFFIGGQDVELYYMEMGFFDLFLFFGIIGLLLYLYIFIKIYNRVSFSYKFKLFFLLALLGIVGLSGHFFNSSIAVTYFIIFVLINYKYQSENYAKQTGS